MKMIDFLPAVNVSAVNERRFRFAGKTHPKLPWQVCLCQGSAWTLGQTEEQLGNSALVLQLPEDKRRNEVA